MAPSVPQVGDLAAVVLAAGAGTRLRPLTWLRPKALCPVENVPLVDLAVGWARTATGAVAVNVHHGRAALESHLAGRVHLSIEEPEALGTAGGVGRRRAGATSTTIGALSSTAVRQADTWPPTWLPRTDARWWDEERVWTEPSRSPSCGRAPTSEPVSTCAAPSVPANTSQFWYGGS